MSLGELEAAAGVKVLLNSVSAGGVFVGTGLHSNSDLLLPSLPAEIGS